MTRSYVVLLIIILSFNLLCQNPNKPTFDTQEYILFVKNLFDSLQISDGVEMIHPNPKFISYKVATENKLPPPPSKILKYPFDKLCFSNLQFITIDSTLFDSIITKLIKKKGAYTDSEIENSVRNILVVSTPYIWENRSGLWIDFEIFDWNQTCTGSYQIIKYK